jgi:hypothetical protein
MDPLLVIVWTCVIVFGVSAIVAILHVTGIYKLPNRKHGEILFKVLIVEIAIIAVASFGANIKSPVSHKVIKPEAIPYDKPEKIPTSGSLQVNPAILEYKVWQIDDQIQVLINNHIVHSGGTTDWTKVPIEYVLLGTNTIRIDVFNQRSFRGGISHRREGWNYSIDFRSHDQVWSFKDSSTGEPPESQFGKWFTTKVFSLLADDKSGKLTLR